MHSFFRSLFVSLWLLTLSINSLHAATPITDVNIPINTTEQQEITPLLTQGLTTVLVRLTGNPNITEQPGITDLLKKPEDYLENYTQQSQPDRLAISFDQSAIETALTKLNIPYWEKQRPIIMIWWLDETTSQATLVDEAQPLAKTITAAATTQGFPLRYPLGDLNEQALANKELFTSNDPKEILLNSQQYATNAILIVDMQRNNNNYRAQWHLWLTSKDAKPLAQGHLEATSEQQIADQLFMNVNMALAKLFVIKTNATETVEIVINNLNFNHYVQINNLMNNFNAKLLETSGATVRYQVTADPVQIKAQLSLLHIDEVQTEPSANQTSSPKVLTFKATDN